MGEARLVEDAWLADRLGKPAFHLEGDVTALATQGHPLSGRLALAPIFADVKLPVGDIAGINAVAGLGFSLIDTNLRFTMLREKAPGGTPRNVRPATPDMADGIAQIAHDSFVFDRFHRDPAIPKGTASKIKRDWAQNFFSGRRGEWMIAACEGDAPIGFLQLLRTPDDDLVIDLIAIDAKHRGRGHALAMISYAVTHCAVSGEVIVGTQVSNVPSVRLYEKLGFRMAEAKYVFHHHGQKC
jgi:ribosomal protein S18 acetylase RimI-like enzyme